MSALRAFVTLLVLLVLCVTASATAPPVAAQSASPTPARSPTPPAPSPTRLAASATPTRSAAAATATATRPSAVVGTATATKAAAAATAAAATVTMLPSATPFAAPAGVFTGKTIVLDPGHGSPDPGALYNGLREADVNLDVALGLGGLLENAGARVVMTRTTDRWLAPAGGGVDDDLQGRVDVANNAGGQVFVSIHANVNSDRDVSGAITFYGPESGFASGATRTARLVARSAQLAGAIEREVVVATGETERGLRQANFWVIGGPRMPAVLVETGFLTNPDEAAHLADPAYRRRLAQGIAAGLARFLSTEDDAQFVRDGSIPDGTAVTPGQQFLKTWRLRNSGVTTWGPGYRLVFAQGDRLGGPASVSLPAPPVPPGGEVEVSVPLVAPQVDAPAALEGEWQLQSPAGIAFGDRVWVSVQVTPPNSPSQPANPANSPGQSGQPGVTVPARVSLPTDPAAPLAAPGVSYADATGHNLGFGFRSFYDSHGGLDIFGYPRTEELVENGYTVQYFQRARFEYHPEHAGTPYEVQLGLLGDLVTAPRRPFPPGASFASSANHRWYAETGHGLHFGFLSYFDTRGGLDVFGYPISEELVENGYTVQYFQRARFEYHPEHAGTPYEVQLGLLGDQTLVQKGWLR